MHGDLTGFLPCTPRGCMKMIEESGIKVQGKRAVVIGRSKIVVIQFLFFIFFPFPCVFFIKNFWDFWNFFNATI